MWCAIGLRPGCFFQPFDFCVLLWNLLSSRSICSAPVRGGTHFLCCCKESKQRKQLPTANANHPSLAFDWDWRWRVSVALMVEPGLARGPTAATCSTTDWCSSHTSVLALRAPTWGAQAKRGVSRQVRAQAQAQEADLVNPTSERSEDGAKRSAYHSEEVRVVTVGPRAKPGSTMRATLTLQRQSQSNASDGWLALAVGSCFLCLLSLQQQRK